MALRRKQCRAHGGIFSYHPNRGKQPVSCKPEYPCDRADTPEYKVGDSVTVGGIKFTKHAEYTRVTPEAFIRTNPRPIGMHDGPDTHPVARDWSQKRPEPLTSVNPSLPLAKAAKVRLEELGWSAKGRAFVDDDGGLCAEVTAARDTELLVMVWRNGECVRQDYSLEPPPAPTETSGPLPIRNLHFNPVDLTDSELVRMIKGMRVTWWNTIAGAKETAIAGGKITIEHIFYESGNEDESKRIVKFVDRDAGGFRAFHVSALLKVG